MSQDSENWPGRAGIAAALLCWALSVPVLAAVMRANEEASRLDRLRGLHGTAQAVAHLHAAATLEGLIFIALQLATLLLLAFVMRAAYRLRTAMCFTIGAGVPLLLDGLGLFGLLVWLRLAGAAA